MIDKESKEPELPLSAKFMGGFCLVLLIFFSFMYIIMNLT